MIIRPLEKSDLEDVHRINNELNIMSYWFEKTYESLSELKNLYERHIHDEAERRFIREGLLRHRFCTKGENKDSLFMGILKREWRSK